MTAKPALPVLTGSVTSQGVVTLSWTPDQNTALVNGYQPQFCPHGSGAWKNIPMPLDVAVSGLPKGTYDFRLVAMSSTMGYNVTPIVTETVSTAVPGSPFSVTFSSQFGPVS